ncbi:MAG: hypothetical protein E7464_00120 [Ruminococcaceae bacterium]|nr:hypothetical protein [Oscillospiraceae bacterium]
MKTWKILPLLCLVLALLAIASPTMAADALQEGIFSYTVAGGEATLTRVEGPVVGPLIIPETLGGYPVTRIATYAVYKEYDSPYAVVPACVEYIEDDAFERSDFDTIYIYGKQTECAVSAFFNNYTVYCYEDAKALESIYYWSDKIFFEDYPCDPLTLTPITDGIFEYAIYNGEAILLKCNTASDVVVPDQLGGCPVTYIGPRCFVGEDFTCTLPDTVRSIGAEAFSPSQITYSPMYLTKLPQSLQRLSQSALSCVSVIDPALPESLETIHDFACENYIADKITIPGTVKTIGKYAFTNAQIKEIVIEEGVEIIGDYAFSGNYTLESITVPASVTQCENFLYNLKELTVYGYLNTAAFDYCGDYGIPFVDLATGEPYEKPYTITKDHVEYWIYPKRYASVSKLLTNHAENLVIPETVDGVPVKEAYDWAFTSKSLKSLYLPDTLTYLGDMAISDCPNLEYVRLSENLETADGEFLLHCPKLTAIYIPSSVTKIGRSDEERIYVAAAGSYAKTFAAVNNHPFVEMEEGKEYVVQGGVYRKEADGLVALALPLTYVDDTYTYCTVPDEVDGIPVVGIGGDAQFVGRSGNTTELQLGSNVRFIEKGALAHSKINVLCTTPALEELPVPLFAAKGEIYGLSGTYAESYAKEHGIFFYPYDGTPFTDVPEDSWYFPSVYFCYWNGIMNGTSDTTFNPTGISSRAMLVTTLYRLCGEPNPDGDSDYFADVPEYTWYTSAVDWAAENGVVYGTSATTFSPNAPVTREQVATILYRLGDLLGEDVATYSPISGFKDADQASDYAKSALMWAVDVGILQGNDKNMLNPLGATTRAEMATILLRYIAWLES